MLLLLLFLLSETDTFEIRNENYVCVQFDGTFLAWDPKAGVKHFDRQGNVIKDFSGINEINLYMNSLWTGDHYLISDGKNRTTNVFDDKGNFFSSHPLMYPYMYFLDGQIILFDGMKVVSEFYTTGNHDSQDILIPAHIESGLLRIPYRPFHSMGQLGGFKGEFHWQTHLLAVGQHVYVFVSQSKRFAVYTRGGILVRYGDLSLPSDYALMDPEFVPQPDRNKEYYVNLLNTFSVTIDVFSHQNLIGVVYNAPSQGIKKIAFFQENGSHVSSFDLPQGYIYAGYYQGSIFLFSPNHFQNTKRKNDGVKELTLENYLNP